MQKKEKTIYLRLGSNQGDARQHIDDACALLADQLEITACSLLYETKPFGYTDQPNFLNLAVQCSTTLSMTKLLDYTQSIEKKIGSKPRFQNGPREIDIDILIASDTIFTNGILTIPHANFHERDIVIRALCDIDDTIVHPVYKHTVAEMLLWYPNYTDNIERTEEYSL